MKQGKFILSLDFELFWGFGGFNHEFLTNYKSNITNAISALDEIIRICNEHGVKVTIAFVGAMRLSSREQFLKEYLSPSFENIELSSHTLISSFSDVISEDLIFCKDKIDSLGMNPMVEIASHTFSHYYCLEKGQNAEDFKRDLEYGYKVNGPMNSIIFPRNQVSENYLELCEQYGFTHYRGFVPNWLWKPEASSSRYSLKGILRLLDTYIPIAGHRTYMIPDSHKGIINVPSSIFLRPYNNSLRLLEPLKVRRIIQSMTVAARKGECFHLWWHPHNFGANMEENLAQLAQICNAYRQLNAKYDYTSAFMKEL